MEKLKLIMNMSNIMRIFWLLFLTISMNTYSVAQTELTTDMVWQEGTHWIYSYEMWRDLPPANYYLRECRLVKYYDTDSNENYLSLECKEMKADGSWSTDWSPYGKLLKVEGDKVCASLLYDEIPQYKGYLYQLYDFSTWNEGETTYFEMVGYRNAPEKTSVTVENMNGL